MANVVAPAGQVFVCSACGKRSRDKYGFQHIDHGWDESCMMYAVLCYEEKNTDGSWRPVGQGDKDGIEEERQEERQGEGTQEGEDQAGAAG